MKMLLNLNVRILNLNYRMDPRRHLFLKFYQNVKHKDHDYKYILFWTIFNQICGYPFLAFFSFNFMITVEVTLDSCNMTKVLGRMMEDIPLETAGYGTLNDGGCQFVA